MPTTDLIRTWYDHSRDDFTAYAMTSTFRVGDAANSPRCATVDAESATGVGQLNVWESGAAELIIGKFEGDDPPVGRDFAIHGQEDFVYALTEMAKAIGAAK